MYSHIISQNLPNLSIWIHLECPTCTDLQVWKWVTQNLAADTKGFCIKHKLDRQMPGAYSRQIQQLEPEIHLVLARFHSFKITPSTCCRSFGLTLYFATLSTFPWSVFFAWRVILKSWVNNASCEASVAFWRFSCNDAANHCKSRVAKDSSFSEKGNVSWFLWFLWGLKINWFLSQNVHWCQSLGKSLTRRTLAELGESCRSTLRAEYVDLKGIYTG